jgi:transcriptional regulator with XRE-family HTH domain
VRRPNPVTAAVGRAVRELRLAAGLSQESVADRSGLHRNYVGGVERGERNPTVEVLFRLGEGLGARPSEILARAEALARD